MCAVKSSSEQLARKAQTASTSALSDRAARKLFILPATFLVLGLTIFPLLFSLGITFTDYRLAGSGETSFIGFANWGRLLSDDNFHTVLRNTVGFTLGTVSLQYLLGLGLALLINQNIRGRRFFRVSLLLPMMMSPIAVSHVIGKMMLSESFGPINHLLLNLGLPALTWTGDPVRSMLVLIFVDTWQWTPLFILVLLAGLQSIPLDLYEAARVDGATSWDLFRYITFPLLMPISITVILLRALEAFKILDIVRVVTGGGPGNSTESLTLFAYDVGLKGGDIAYASTVAVALLIVVIIFSLTFLISTRRFVPSK